MRVSLLGDDGDDGDDGATARVRLQGESLVARLTFGVRVQVAAAYVNSTSVSSTVRSRLSSSSGTAALSTARLVRDCACGYGIALTEPGSGSDAGGLRTAAKPVPGGWVLNGEKTAISFAMNATVALVYAREAGTTRASGVSCFVVPLDSDGVSVSHMMGMGCLPLGWGSIHFDNVFVPHSHLIGEEGHGFRTVMNHFDFSRAALGLLCLGAAKQSLEEAAVYAQQRETFGRPIAENQGISFQLAEHATYIEGARWTCYRALWLRETGQPHTALASMSKWWAPVVAKNAIESSMRIHGNLGYSTEFPIQQRFRDVMAYLSADGTSEIQKHVIARDIFARGTVSL
ncbi:acyl-CoA dehydrogenase [Antrihabitans sp. YC2-6]|nr:acyl-CoA dehydrogenase [Antrihabitans sp. YC2-6]